MALEARGVAVEQRPDIGRRQGGQAVPRAEAGEVHLSAEGAVRVDVAGTGIGPQRPGMLARIVAVPGQPLPHPAEQHPRRDVARRPFEDLLGEVGGREEIAIGEAGLGVAIAAVGEDIPGTVLRGHASAGSGATLMRAGMASHAPSRSDFPDGASFSPADRYDTPRTDAEGAAHPTGQARCLHAPATSSP